MKWKTRESMHCHAIQRVKRPPFSERGSNIRRAYFFSRSVLRRRFAALTLSELWEACSAAISQSVLIAAAE